MKRALIAFLFAGAAVLVTAAPAAAHNALIGSDPKDKSSLEVGPSTVTLTFDQDVQGGQGINAISVVDSNGGHYEAAGDPTIKDTAVSAKVNALGKAGEYKIGYRILSADGHPVSGELTFDQDVQGGQGINAISVVDSNGGHYEAAGDPTIKDTAVSAKVNALGKAGEYKIGYRILSADGHPVSGELTFTLTKDGTGTPTAAPNNAASGDSGSSDGLPIWVWIAGAVVLLGGGVFFALRGGGTKA